ncbi:hypothetical protein U7230_05175 [Carboxydochorda subterranea]|uniref:Radical SAM core domain-containing protein n=1 Tax=Carboxydichorda subterranea TaxID=3109565 RepID=A0ABZ1C003_9FIRM|nr:hypothetical protein [Limnochorda sp. L945t]WRP18402.1 hypothetical protein U7230_05175 [Limnochorda sp. L945t]
MPLNRRWPLEALLSAVREYTRATRRRVSFEYVLLAGINDSPAQARLLARRIEGMLAHVNLIPYNPVPGVPFEPSDERAAQAFGATLKARGIAVTLRRPRGRRIDAACGQLGARHVTANVSRG